jgi:hypothetical protein
MYDLRTDPLERKNLAWWSYRRSAEEQRELGRLLAKLERVKATRLQPLPGVTPVPAAPEEQQLPSGGLPAA